MRLIEEPSQESYALPVREYRVTFWQHQLPLAGSDFTPEEMGWSAHHFDFSEVEDVHEVIEWAEEHFDEHTTPESDRGYVLGIWTPTGLLDEQVLIQIAGFDPTHSDGMESNLRRRPLR